MFFVFRVFGFVFSGFLGFCCFLGFASLGLGFRVLGS